MAIQINWDIVQMERNAADGGVFTVHWSVNGNEQDGDNNYSASSYGSMGLTPDPLSETFVPFENLTKEVVIAWVKEQMGEEQVTNMENGLSSQIETQKNPPTLSGMPWTQL